MQNLKDKILKLKEDVTLVSIEDEAALLDVESRCYYDPNDTAFFILKLIEDGIAVDDIRTELLSEFDVDERLARLDLDAFIEELLKLTLIEIRVAGMARRDEGRTKKEKKAYHSPLLEHPTAIEVAAASSVISAN